MPYMRQSADTIGFRVDSRGRLSKVASRDGAVTYMHYCLRATLRDVAIAIVASPEVATIQALAQVARSPISQTHVAITFLLHQGFIAKFDEGSRGGPYVSQVPDLAKAAMDAFEKLGGSAASSPLEEARREIDMLRRENAELRKQLEAVKL